MRDNVYMKQVMEKRRLFQEDFRRQGHAGDPAWVRSQMWKIREKEQHMSQSIELAFS